MPAQSQASPRAFLGRVWTAFLLAVVLTAVAIGAAYWTAMRKIDHIPKVRIDPALLEPGGNYLLIGSDSRSFVDNAKDSQSFGSKQSQSGQRSDTIMVAHINGDGSGVLVSFPRDLWVAIPGLGHAKINAAFNAGPQRVIETIEQDFDVPISHYIQVDFEGFRNIVNALGTVPIYFPTPARDVKSGLYVTEAGCRQLNGDQALAFVRSRYYESYQNGKWSFDPSSDLGRVKRQQYFLRTIAQQALHTSVRSPWKAPAIVDKLLANLQRDPKLNFSATRALAYAFHGGRSDLETLTLPTNRQFFDGQDALALDTAKAEPILERLRGASAPSTKAVAGVAPKSVHIAVKNGSGQHGVGSTAVAAFRGFGFAVPDAATNADRSNYTTTQIQYAPGAENKARLVQSYLGGAGSLLVSSSTVDADVVVVIGRDLPQIAAPAAKPKATATTPASPASTPGSTLPVAGC